MKRDELHELIEQARLRPLSQDKERRLKVLLEADLSRWPEREEDMALTRLLDKLPDAPLASNFSSRVMQTIGLEEQRTSPTPHRFRPQAWARNWFIRLGFGSTVALILVLGWNQTVQQERKQIAESVVTVSEVASVPSVEVLVDFEAIQSLGAVPPDEDVEADLTLLAALE
jgi:hypothetical protein